LSLLFFPSSNIIGLITYFPSSCNFISAFDHSICFLPSSMQHSVIIPSTFLLALLMFPLYPSYFLFSLYFISFLLTLFYLPSPFNLLGLPNLSSFPPPSLLSYFWFFFHPSVFSCSSIIFLPSLLSSHILLDLPTFSSFPQSYFLFSILPSFIFLDC